MGPWGPSREVEKLKRQAQAPPDDITQRERAKQLLTHYFRTAFNASELRFDGDSAADVRDIVDAIVDAAAAAHLAALRVRVADLEVRLSALEGKGARR